MTQPVQFVFDFGSPNAYFAYRALPPLLERTGATLEFLPCLLGGIFKATGNQPPWMAFSQIPAKLNYMQTEIHRFAARHGIDAFRMNPNFPVNTLMMMRGAVAAQEEGQIADYVEVCMTAMWERELKMDDAEVFAKTLGEAGMDAAALLAATQDPAIKAKLAANTESAVERGTFGIPTFFLGEELFFGKDSLPDLEFALSQ